MADETPVEPIEETTDAPDLAVEVEKWKSLSRKNEKAAQAALKRVDEFENASKTETERLAARAEAAEKAAADNELTAMRLSVAFDKGLTPAQAKRLVGATRDDLEADADEILRDFPTAEPPKRPRGDIDQGGRGKPVPQNPRDVFASLLQTRQ